METKLIKVYSTTNANAKPVELRFNGNTQGDLLRVLGINSSNITVRGKQTRSEYPFNDSILSEEDTFFFIGPKKLDSGIDLDEDTIDELNNLKNELMIRIENTFDEIFDIIENSESDSTNTEACDECEQLKNEAKNLGF